MYRRTVRVACWVALMAGVSVAVPALAEPSATTRIEVDPAAEQIRFVVGGVHVAYLVSTGLIVTGDVSFDGHLTDRKSDR